MVVGSVEVVAQDLRPAGVAQLRHRLALDLPDPLAGHPVDLADLVERARLAVCEPEAQPDDAGLPLRERLQDAGQLVLHEREAHRVDGDDQDSSLGDFIEDADAPIAAEVVSYGLMQEQLGEVLRTLTDREAAVVKMRFGLVDGQPRTLDEIGREFGLTRERIRQIESKTLSKLRHPSRSQKLRDYLD